MTDRVSLADFLYRVLEGSGPDLELDAEIAVLIGGWERRWFGGGGHPSPGFYWRKGDYSWTKDGDTPPYYTGSLDATITLVRPGWDWVRRSPSTMALERENDRPMCQVHPDPIRALLAACIAQDLGAA